MSTDIETQVCLKKENLKINNINVRGSWNFIPFASILLVQHPVKSVNVFEPSINSQSNECNAVVGSNKLSCLSFRLYFNVIWSYNT